MSTPSRGLPESWSRQTRVEEVTERTAYHGQSASGYSRQHNGNNINNHYYQYSARKRRSDETMREDQRDTALLAAAADGHTLRVGYLIRLGADLDSSDEQGLTALHHAVLSGFEDTIDLLLQSGADLEAQSRDCGTPLHLAALRARTNIAQTLLKYRAKVNAHSRLLGSPLHCACFAGALEIVTALLGAGAQIRSFELLSIHLLSNAPNSNRDGHSTFVQGEPLAAAVLGHEPLFVRRLIAAGAPPMAMAKLWETKEWDNLSFSSPNNIEPGTQLTALHLATINNDVDMCRTLLSILGVDVDSADSKGNTPLLWAAFTGHADCAKLFLEHGASAERKEQTGRTAMVAAVGQGDTEIMRLLVEYGPPVELTELAFAGQTLLHYAVSRGQVQSAKMLVEMGASASSRNKAGETPLQYLLRLRPRPNDDGARRKWDERYGEVRELLTARPRGP